MIDGAAAPPPPPRLAASMAGQLQWQAASMAGRPAPPQVELSSAARLVFLTASVKRSAALLLISVSQIRGCFVCSLGDLATAMRTDAAALAAAVDGDPCFHLQGYPSCGRNSLLALNPGQLLRAAQNTVMEQPPPTSAGGDKPTPAACRPAALTNALNNQPPCSSDNGQPPDSTTGFYPGRHWTSYCGGPQKQHPAISSATPDAAAMGDRMAAVAAAAAAAAAGKQGESAQQYASVYTSVFATLFKAAAASGNLAATGNPGCFQGSSNPGRACPAGNSGPGQPWPFTVVPPGALLSAVPATLEALHAAAGAAAAAAAPVCAASRPPSQQAAGGRLPQAASAAGSKLLALLRQGRRSGGDEAGAGHGPPQMMSSSSQCWGPAGAVVSAPAGLIMCPAPPAAPSPPDATAAAAAAAAARGLQLGGNNSSQPAVAPADRSAGPTPLVPMDTSLSQPQQLQSCSSLRSWGSSSRASSLSSADVAAWAAAAACDNSSSNCSQEDGAGGQPCRTADRGLATGTSGCGAATDATTGQGDSATAAAMHAMQAALQEASDRLDNSLARLRQAAAAATPQPAPNNDAVAAPAASTPAASEDTEINAPAATAATDSPPTAAPGSRRRCMVIHAPPKPGQLPGCLAGQSQLANAAALAAGALSTLSAQGALRQQQDLLPQQPGGRFLAGGALAGHTMQGSSLSQAPERLVAAAGGSQAPVRPALRVMTQQPASPFAHQHASAFNSSSSSSSSSAAADASAPFASCRQPPVLPPGQPCVPRWPQHLQPSGAHSYQPAAANSSSCGSTNSDSAAPAAAGQGGFSAGGGGRAYQPPFRRQSYEQPTAAKSASVSTTTSNRRRTSSSSDSGGGCTGDGQQWRWPPGLPPPPRPLPVARPLPPWMQAAAEGQGPRGCC